MATAAAAACVLAGLQIAVVLAGLPIEGLLNLVTENSSGGIRRLYFWSSDLIALGIPFAVGYALMRGDQKRSRVAAVAALLFTVALALQLTRALYLGVSAGLLVSGALWLSTGLGEGRRGLRRLVGIGFALALIGALIAVTVPQSSATDVAAKAVIDRFGSSTSAFSSSSQDTLVYRQNVSDDMLHLLGNNWVFGLGYISPDSTYFPDLPLGSIRNTDVGVLNSLMTSGIVGVVLQYFPFFFILGALVTKRLHVRTSANRGAEPDRSWEYFGYSGVLLCIIVTSPTLVIMFHETGLCLCGFLIAGAAASLSDGPSETRCETES